MWGHIRHRVKCDVTRCYHGSTLERMDVQTSFCLLRQTRGPATENARSPTVERLTDGTIRGLVPPERNVRRPGRLATGTSFKLIYHYHYLSAVHEYFRTRMASASSSSNRLHSRNRHFLIIFNEIDHVQPFSALLSALIIDLSSCFVSSDRGPLYKAFLHSLSNNLVAE